MYNKLIRILAFIIGSFAFQIGGIYEVPELLSFWSPEPMEIKVDTIQSSIGEMLIHKYTSNDSIVNEAEFSCTYYTYPKELQEIIFEEKSLVDTLVYNVAKEIAIETNASIDYRSTELFQNSPSCIFRLSYPGGIYQKGRAIYYKGHMIIFLLNSHDKFLKSKIAEQYFENFKLL